MIKNSDPLIKARQYAFLLLKYRLRSEEELRLRFRRKKFDTKTIEETISFLRQKRFIDDRLFCRAWIDSRLKRPYGLRRIKLELKKKGIPAKVIEEESAKVCENYSESSEILELAKTRFEKLKDMEPYAAKRRLYAWLLRKGFNPESVSEAIEQL